MRLYLFLLLVAMSQATTIVWLRRNSSESRSLSLGEITMTCGNCSVLEGFSCCTIVNQQCIYCPSESLCLDNANPDPTCVLPGRPAWMIALAILTSILLVFGCKFALYIYWVRPRPGRQQGPGHGQGLGPPGPAEPAGPSYLALVRSN